MKEELKRKYKGIPSSELKSLFMDCLQIVTKCYSNLYKILFPIIGEKIEGDRPQVVEKIREYPYYSHWARYNMNDYYFNTFKELIEDSNTPNLIKDLKEREEYNKYLYYLETVQKKLHNIDLFDFGSQIYRGNTVYRLTYLDKLGETRFKEINKRPYLYLADSYDTVAKALNWLSSQGYVSVKVYFKDVSYLKWYKHYQELVGDIEKIKNLIDPNTEKTKLIPLSNEDFTDQNGYIYPYFNKREVLEKYDLSDISFKNASIEGLDISGNINNIKLNFDYLEKTLKNTNLEGYPMNGYKLNYWNLENANLKGTGAGVDLLTCVISPSTKMSEGTQFDETNKFYFGGVEMAHEDVEKLGIKIYRKEK